MTLGSLFDGIGGFPLAGVMCGIIPVWASEIELFPMKVTAARFPEMKQLGSVTDINGAEIEPVDIITFGSPCQDLSVAGKQLGIHEGQRSNLFFEAVRIIKEMRKADERTGRTGKHIRPRFAVWENVPGAFSSNGGEDFKAVLEALAGVMQDGLDIPRPKKWNHAGGVAGDGWSIAWRVYDAQYWGVPQRRKRIYLVADFAGERAPEILFEREGMSGDSTASGEAWEGAANDAAGGAGGSDRVRCLNPWDYQSKRQHDVTGCYPTLQAYNGGGGRCDGVVYPINTMVATRGGKDDMRTCFGIGEPGDPQFTISAAHEHGVCYALQGNGIDRSDTAGCGGAGWRTDTMYTLNTVDRPAIAATCGSFIQTSEDVGLTLMARDYKDPQIVAVDSKEAQDTLAFQLSGDRANPSVSVSETAYCIPANPMSDRGQQVAYKSGEQQRKYVVRRLTPTECARLQGFPDEWCEGLCGSDSAIYKAYGNGLALPCAYDVLRRIAKAYESETTL